MKRMQNISTLKSFPVNNSNRDKNGVPKVCTFGSTKRGRISSQCLKHHVRRNPFLTELIIQSDSGQLLDTLAIQTRKLVMALDAYVNNAKERFDKLGGDDFKELLGTVLKSEENRVYTRSELEEIFDIIEKWVAENGGPDKCMEIMRASKDSSKEKGSGKKSDENELTPKKICGKLVQKILDCLLIKDTSLDIALFGAMIAKASRRIDGAVNVAHSFTTHTLESIESDFFVTVDMCDPNSGSAYMDTQDFTTGVYYNFLSIDTQELIDNLNEFGYAVDSEKVARDIVRSLTMAFALGNQGSKQSSMASYSYPSVVLIDQCDEPYGFSYANAFERPVEKSKEGYLLPSIIALKNEVEKDARKFDVCNIEHHWFCTEDITIDSKYGVNHETFSDLLNSI